jgi:hypothetical protein
MNSDRIKEVQQLLARFPERSEYQMSSSEFQGVKARVVSLSAASRASRDDRGRPTLKRRDPATSGDGAGQTEAPERPTLKRRDPATETDDAGAQPEAPERPTLKRRPESNSGQ